MIHEAREFAQALCAWLDANAHRLTLDADVHATDLLSLSGARRERYLSSPDYYHGRPISAEDIIAEMDSAQVDAALAWQNPAATAYTNDQDFNFDSLLRANTCIRDISRRYPHRFIPGGWTDPKACGIPHARRIAEICVQEFGFLFVKMNPAQNRYPIDGPEVLEIVDCIVSLGAIPVFHFGGDTPYTPAEGLETLALRYPDHPILAILIDGAHHTDPRLRQQPNLFSPEAARNYLGGNFARFVSAGYRQLLQASGVTAVSCPS
jgi:predicted TIM-barrel fold metal-dependent hydrolase